MFRIEKPFATLQHKRTHLIANSTASSSIMLKDVPKPNCAVGKGRRGSQANGSSRLTDEIQHPRGAIKDRAAVLQYKTPTLGCQEEHAED